MLIKESDSSLLPIIRYYNVYLTSEGLNVWGFSMYVGANRTKPTILWTV